MREPTIFWGPGLVEKGVITDLGSTLDLFTTFSVMANIPVPNGTIHDGVDLSKTLLRGAPSPRNSMLYYRGTELYAARLGDYKAHFITQGAYGEFGKRIVYDVPLLYNLAYDPGEHFNIADAHPYVLKQIENLVLEHNSQLVRVKNQLIDRE